MFSVIAYMGLVIILAAFHLYEWMSEFTQSLPFILQSKMKKCRMCPPKSAGLAPELTKLNIVN